MYLLDTENDAERVIAQKNEHHKTCEQNRAYAHCTLQDVLINKYIRLKLSQFTFFSNLLLLFCLHYFDTIKNVLELLEISQKAKFVSATSFLSN